VYDKTGDRYKRGKGLRVLADGREIAASQKLGRLGDRPSAGRRAGGQSRPGDRPTRREPVGP
jgi:hypothetical protein